MIRTYALFLTAEILIIIAAITCFQTIKQPMVAGFVAGVLFVALGAWIFVSGLRNKAVRKSGTFALGCVHLFVVALPMMITRFMNTSLAFSDVRILGLPGPVFHQLSTVVYFCMMVASLADLIWAWHKSRTPQAE